MNHKKIKDFENYIIYDNSDIKNIKTDKKLKPEVDKNYNYKIGLRKKSKQYYFSLSKLVYETFSEDILKKDETIKFKDNDKNNLNYENLIKIHKTLSIIGISDKLKLDKDKKWSVIKNYEMYQISDHGDVYSTRSNKLLNLSINNEGYHRVSLSIQNKSKSYLVHRLVYDTFRGLQGGKLVIDHIDGKRDNNFIDNLREVSSSDNAKNSQK